MSAQDTPLQPDPTNGPEAGSNGVDAAEKKIQELEAQLKEKDQKYLYLYAEFENFKKRAVKERADLMKFGWEPVAAELLQVLDNLERAITHLPKDAAPAVSEGLRMVHQQFQSTLKKQGVEVIEALKKPFDPNLHEAVASEPSEEASGTVVREHLRGYLLHGRLLRPARVAVSSGPSATA